MASISAGAGGLASLIPREHMLCLQALYFQDVEALELYGDASYWESISNNQFTVTTDPKAWEKHCEPLLSSSLSLDLLEPPTTDQLSQLNNDGYAILTSAIDSNHPIFTTIEMTLRNLAARGWPPAFIFMYDQVWELLIAPLFDVYASVLGRDCWMEPDLNCWMLRSSPSTIPPTTPSTIPSTIPLTTPPTTPSATSSTTSSTTPMSLIPPTTTSTPSFIGINFGKSHRDMTYEACHNTKTEEYHSLNCWVPINPSGATIDNGCMHVIPIEHDDYFYDTKHPYHMSTAKGLSYLDNIKECTVLLPCDAGSIVTWTPSLIHWGGACKPGITDPRMSIAATFRKNNTKRSVYGDANEEHVEHKEAEEKGPPSIQKKDIGKIGLSRRLAYIGKSIIAFAHWYPGFPGLSVERLKTGSKVLSPIAI